MNAGGGSVMNAKLDEARRILAARVDAFAFAVGDWERSEQPREKRAHETMALNRLNDSLDALLGCFDPLLKLGGLNRKAGPPGTFVEEVGAFRAEGKHVDLILRKHDQGINFTDQSPGGVLTSREVINRVEKVDELFATLAHRLEKLIHDERVADHPELRALIADLAGHAESLHAPCLAFSGLPRPV